MDLGFVYATKTTKIEVKLFCGREIYVQTAKAKNLKF